MAWNGRHLDVLIAIPNSGGMVYFDWAMEFNGLIKPPNTFVVSAPEPQIDVAREKLCEMALNYNAKHIFFLDADVLCPKDTIPRLIRHNLPIVSGLYARRHYPCWNEMMVRAKDDKGNEGYTSIPEGGYEKGELINCDAVGFGCVLIQTEILKEIEKPWFKWTEGGAIRGLSEDFFFCRRAKQSGFKIIVDTSVICRHMGPIKIIPAPNPNSPSLEFHQHGVRGDL